MYASTPHLAAAAANEKLICLVEQILRTLLILKYSLGLLHANSETTNSNDDVMSKLQTSGPEQIPSFKLKYCDNNFQKRFLFQFYDG